MSDLVEFLRARIDEDEAVARATVAIRVCNSEGRWEAEQHYEPERGCRCLSCEVPVEGVAAIHGIDALGQDHSPILHATDAEHIARWDPARVLAEVEAKRAILAECGRLLPICIDPMTPAGIVALALARTYADHPDFDPAWSTS